MATVRVTTAAPAAAQAAIQSSTFTQSVANALPRYSSVVASTPTTTLQAVLDGWDNHFTAFGTQDVPRILLDYTNTSVLKSYEQCEGVLTEAVGLTEIGAFFTGLFSGLDATHVSAPVVDVSETTADANQVYLIWKAPLSGIESAQDTFIFRLATRSSALSCECCSRPTTPLTSTRVPVELCAGMTARSRGRTSHGPRRLAPTRRPTRRVWRHRGRTTSSRLALRKCPASCSTTPRRRCSSPKNRHSQSSSLRSCKLFLGVTRSCPGLIRSVSCRIFYVPHPHRYHITCTNACIMFYTRRNTIYYT